jgi:hypothetical protein
VTCDSAILSIVTLPFGAVDCFVEFARLQGMRIPMPTHFGRFRASLNPAQLMVWTLIVLVLTVCGLLTPATAHSLYCAQYPGGTENCGYPTFESCRQAVSGLGGICTQAPATPPPPNLLQRLEGQRNPSPPQLPGGNWMPPPPDE